jgi:hypothetical protein
MRTMRVQNKKIEQASTIYKKTYFWQTINFRIVFYG